MARSLDHFLIDKGTIGQSMRLICLERPSAVGKSTVSKALAEHYAAYVIPEVNQLFERPTPESTQWYFERQVERWAIAQDQLKTHEIEVLPSFTALAKSLDSLTLFDFLIKCLDTNKP